MRVRTGEGRSGLPVLVLAVALGWLLGVGREADEADLSGLSLEELLQVRVSSASSAEEPRQEPTSCARALSWNSAATGSLGTDRIRCTESVGAETIERIRSAWPIAFWKELRIV